MAAYYNEIEPFAVAWLRQLIAEGVIPDGEVDNRDIRDVRPGDLVGFDQCHFFAGIGGWAEALRLAGWPDDQPVWTGSCPCQPFSTAGKREGFDDERHLWPDWHWLIQECTPPVIFGEQVADGAARDWIDLVQSDLEGLGYAFGAANLPVGGVGAPHQRQRAWFVAESYGGQRGLLSDSQGRQPHGTATGWIEGDGCVADDCPTRQLAHANGGRAGDGHLQPGGKHGQQPTDRGAGQLAHADDKRPQGRDQRRVGAGKRPAGQSGLAQCEPFASALHGFWRDADWLLCTDERWRPVEPGTFPLADGVPGRVGLLRGYGGAITPQVAAAFIAACSALPSQQWRR